MKDETTQRNDAHFYRAFNALLVDCTSLIVQSDENNFKDRMDQVLEKIGLSSKVETQKIFNRFYRTKSVQEGMGLGYQLFKR